MTFLMTLRDADWVRGLLDLTTMRSIATAGWIALLSSIGAAVWSTPELAVKVAKKWAGRRRRFRRDGAGETGRRSIFDGDRGLEMLPR